MTVRFAVDGEYDPQIKFSGHGMMPKAEANIPNSLWKQACLSSSPLFHIFTRKPFNLCFIFRILLLKSRNMKMKLCCYASILLIILSR